MLVRRSSEFIDVPEHSVGEGTGPQVAIVEQQLQQALLAELEPLGRGVCASTSQSV